MVFRSFLPRRLDSSRSFLAFFMIGFNSRAKGFCGMNIGALDF